MSNGPHRIHIEQDEVTTTDLTDEQRAIADDLRGEIRWAIRDERTSPDHAIPTTTTPEHDRQVYRCHGQVVCCDLDHAITVSVPDANATRLLAVTADRFAPGPGGDVMTVVQLMDTIRDNDWTDVFLDERDGGPCEPGTLTMRDDGETFEVAIPVRHPHGYDVEGLLLDASVDRDEQHATVSDQAHAWQHPTGPTILAATTERAELIVGLGDLEHTTPTGDDYAVGVLVDCRDRHGRGDAMATLERLSCPPALRRDLADRLGRQAAHLAEAAKGSRA